jgi:hypothetical protein
VSRAAQVTISSITGARDESAQEVKALGAAIDDCLTRAQVLQCRLLL